MPEFPRYHDDLPPMMSFMSRKIDHEVDDVIGNIGIRNLNF